MKTLEITKYQKIETTDKRDLEIGIVAFQLVKFDVYFYGKLISDVLDTKIMRDGRQIVIDGNGFIPSGYEL
jgi:hypothetical protein